MNISKKNKSVIILFIFVLLVISIMLAISLLLSREHEKGFSLSKIYDVYPDEVRNLYANIVDVSTCSGDLYFDIDVMSGKISVENLDKDTLVNYLFSYLEKNGYLNDNEFRLNIIDNAINNVFSKDIDVKNLINGYVYKNYTYYISGDKVIREKAERCTSYIEYVSQLYAYSYTDDMLFIDINFGYLKDGVLYDLAGNNLGVYDRDERNLDSLFLASPYYRFGYIKEGDKYKLDILELSIKY